MAEKLNSVTTRSLQGHILTVKNLDPCVTDEDMEGLFSLFEGFQYGKVNRDECGNHTGSATILYDNLMSARTACNKYTGRLLDGRILDIEYTRNTGAPAGVNRKYRRGCKVNRVSSGAPSEERRFSFGAIGNFDNTVRDFEEGTGGSRRQTICFGTAAHGYNLLTQGNHGFTENGKGNTAVASTSTSSTLSCSSRGRGYRRGSQRIPEGPEPYGRNLLQSGMQENWNMRTQQLGGAPTGISKPGGQWGVGRGRGLGENWKY